MKRISVHPNRCQHDDTFVKASILARADLIVQVYSDQLDQEELAKKVSEETECPGRYVTWAL